MLTDAVRLLVFPALMAFAASSDLFTMTISNRVTLALVGGFVAMALHQRHEPERHAGSCRRRGHGACGHLRVLRPRLDRRRRRQARGRNRAVVRLRSLVVYLLYASIFGGVLTLAMIRFRLMPLPQALAEQEWVKRLHRLDGGVPYGIALAAAALLIYPDTAWMQLG